MGTHPGRRPGRTPGRLTASDVQYVSGGVPPGARGTARDRKAPTYALPLRAVPRAPVVVTQLPHLPAEPLGRFRSRGVAESHGSVQSVWWKPDWAGPDREGHWQVVS
ncbi:hypothetical protein GCM10010193_24520 [Kitasatospora atroaurantiaca]